MSEAILYQLRQANDAVKTLRRSREELRAAKEAADEAQRKVEEAEVQAEAMLKALHGVEVFVGGDVTA